MNKAVIVSASRTPIGKFLGQFAALSAVELGAATLRETLRRSGLGAADVEEVILGQVVQAGNGQNPARQAALQSGLPKEVAALTINKVCGSGLKAVMLAAQSIRAGDQSAVLAGGMESMSSAPYLLPRARQGYRMGHQEVQDANIQDGLWCAVNHEGMGLTGERVADKYAISRQEQDAYAAHSHHKALSAQQAGHFDDELVAVTVPGRKGEAIISHDEGPRPDTTPQSLAALRPAFREGGSVTAGNAPGLNDAAASLLLMDEAVARARGLTPLAEVLGYAAAGLEPEWVMMTPVPATQKLLKQLGMQLSDVDLWELNEAFSVQSLAVTRELNLNPARVNVNGGAVALGHPIGASGARILVTLLSALKQQGQETGVATLCMGGGNGLALAVRRLS